MLFISLLAATAVAPTNLRCTFAPTSEVLVTADEANSTAVVSIPATGYLQKLPASFTPTMVRFGNRVMTWEINRVDLSAQRTFNGGDSDRSGKCAVETAPPRAF